MMSKEQCSTIANQSSSHFSLGSHLASIQANILPVPIMPSFPCTSVSTESSFQLRNQFLAANAEAQGISSHDAQILHDLLQSDPVLLNHSDAGYSRTRSRNESDISSVVNQALSSGVGTKVSSSRYPAMPQYDVSQDTLLQDFSGESGLTLLTGLNGLHEIMSNVGRCTAGKCSPHGVVVDPTCSSIACSVIEDNLSVPRGTSIAQELSAMLVPKFPELLTPAHDAYLSEPNPTNNQLQSNALPQQMRSHPTASRSDNIPTFLSASSSLSQGNDYSSMSCMQVSSRSVENTISPSADILGTTCDGKLNSSGDRHLLSDADLFDGMELELRHMFQGQGFWDDVFMPVENDDHHDLNINVSENASAFDKDAMSGNEKGFFSEFGLRHILDSIGDNKVDSSTSHSSVITCVKSANNPEPENQFSASSYLENAPSSNRVQQAVLPCFIETADMLLTRGNVEKIMQESSEGQPSKCNIGPWIDDSYSMNTENPFINKIKKPEESIKIQRKRSKAGESTRPRPKDRQQIQDRVKELREIVPNGAKCSIDALLARTVNHMLFLQGVIKYADKIKQADEPKMIGEETGVILRDSPSSGGGATWAYEVAGQTIVCPITVKELKPLGQMLIEILCEDRGSFLEIADSIRSFGLTILKGVMEARDKKIWAHFLVEANQDVTRMEIFLHLVQLLTKTSGVVGSSDHLAKVIDGGIATFNNYQHSIMPIPISLADRGR